MPESPMLSHCSSRSLYIFLNLAIHTYQRDIRVWYTALAVTSNFDCGDSVLAKARKRGGPPL